MFTVQIYGYKGVACKIFRINDLRMLQLSLYCQRSLDRLSTKSVKSSYDGFGKRGQTRKYSAYVGLPPSASGAVDFVAWQSLPQVLISPAPSNWGCPILRRFCEGWEAYSQHHHRPKEDIGQTSNSVSHAHPAEDAPKQPQTSPGGTTDISPEPPLLCRALSVAEGEAEGTRVLGKRRTETAPRRTPVNMSRPQPNTHCHSKAPSALTRPFGQNILVVLR
jgi:hypothetical protein